ncbi:MAG: tyrosinase family protein [Acidobacteriia bacterium]|nr:tyrosinase family protein [Terriglobia bacterium]
MRFSRGPFSHIAVLKAQIQWLPQASHKNGSAAGENASAELRLLRQFELALQAAAGDPNLAIPYWDWEVSGNNSPFTDFLGGDGDNAQGHRVVTGPFAYSTKKFTIRVWDAASGNAGLLREFGTDPTAFLPTPTQVASALTKTPYSPGPNRWEKTVTSIDYGKPSANNIPRATPTCRPPARQDTTWAPRCSSRRPGNPCPGRVRGKSRIRSTPPALAIPTRNAPVAQEGGGCR